MKWRKKAVNVFTFDLLARETLCLLFLYVYLVTYGLKNVSHEYWKSSCWLWNGRGCVRGVNMGGIVSYVLAMNGPKFLKLLCFQHMSSLFLWPTLVHTILGVYRPKNSQAKVFSVSLIIWASSEWIRFTIYQLYIYLRPNLKTNPVINDDFKMNTQVSKNIFKIVTEFFLLFNQLSINEKAKLQK